MPMYRVVTTDLLHNGELIREGGSVEMTTREAAGKRYLERLPDPAPPAETPREEPAPEPVPEQPAAQDEPPQEKSMPEPAPEKPAAKPRSRAKKRGGKS